MENSKYLLSAVVACYKDAESIPIMHKRLTDVFLKIGCRYEIIFVNDGSPDNSEEILEKICHQDYNSKAIIHSRNFSSQNSFTVGMREAKGDAVILLDGDLQDPPELIEEFFNTEYYADFNVSIINLNSAKDIINSLKWVFGEE